MLDPDMMKQLGSAMALAAEMAVAVTLGAFAGYWLDSRLGTSPTFLLALALLGLVVGFVRLIRTQQDLDPPDGGPPG